MTLDHCPHGHFLGSFDGRCAECFRDAAMWAAFVHELRAEWLAAELRLAEDAYADSRLVFRPRDTCHEDDGPCLGWTLPVREPPYCGTPLDDDYPDYRTHWSPLPSNSEIEWAELAAGWHDG